MRVITLLYHDVVPPGNAPPSGFPGGDAWIYKLALPLFQQHLDSIRAVAGQTPPPLLTFDDGGSSAHDYVADLLESIGWRGYFFVATNWIGRSGFLNRDQIRDLHRRGHLIGSHSCSHPLRMSHCSRSELDAEWKNSAGVLADILGEPVKFASVPGGYFGRNVAESAADAGIQVLFTSEPRTRIDFVNGCAVVGRYMIQRDTSAAAAAAIARGSIVPRCRQYVYWNAKKIAKAAGGTQWLRMRKWILARG